MGIPIIGRLEMQFLTGMYDGKIDDKGRLSLPARLRNALSSEQVVILPGLDGNHLMLMTPDYFENQFCKQILSTPLALMNKEKRQLVRLLISPAQYVDIDTAGRINIPLRSRTLLNLLPKSEALLVGTGFAVEIWNPTTYEEEEEKDSISISDLAQKIYDGEER